MSVSLTQTQNPKPKPKQKRAVHHAKSRPSRGVQNGVRGARHSALDRRRPPDPRRRHISPPETETRGEGEREFEFEHGYDGRQWQ